MLNSGTSLFLQRLTLANLQISRYLLPHLTLFNSLNGYKITKIKLSTYREAGVGAVDVDGAPRCRERNAAAFTSQHVLTGPLEVKGPPVEGVVVRVSKDCTHPRLW